MTPFTGEIVVLTGGRDVLTDTTQLTVVTNVVTRDAESST